MNATIQFILSVIASLSNWIRGNPVCAVGFVLVGVNILAFIIDKLKKLLL